MWKNIVLLKNKIKYKQKPVSSNKKKKDFPFVRSNESYEQDLKKTYKAINAHDGKINL